MAKSKLRTIVYIDGFNFYYGQLKDGPYKWLDLTKLFKAVLGEENHLVRIKYFTARVQPTDRDPQVNIRQDTYFRALNTHCPEVEIHFGHFLRHKVFAENANPPPNKLQIFKTEEKGSDVNLALHVLNDAWADAYDCAVIVSNDSDLATALKLVKEQHKKVLGLITPGAPKRNTSWQLRQYASFVKIIRPWALERSLLPNPIPGTEITRPKSW
ncbi:MAG: NYN domain-containing protein [Pseudomonadota bacterium]